MRQTPVMADCPIARGKLLKFSAPAGVAMRHGVTAYPSALTWVLRNPSVIAVSKASDAWPWSEPARNQTAIVSSSAVSRGVGLEVATAQRRRRRRFAANDYVR